MRGRIIKPENIDKNSCVKEIHVKFIDYSYMSMVSSFPQILTGVLNVIVDIANVILHLLYVQNNSTPGPKQHMGVVTRLFEVRALVGIMFGWRGTPT